MDEAVLELLSDVAHGYQSQMRDPAYLGKVGLAPFQARTLAFIARFPGRPQHELAVRSGRDKGQVARVIKELEVRGLIMRRSDPVTRRAFRMEVTKEGARIFDLLQARRAEVAAAMLRDVSPEERAVLSDVLAKMEAGLSAMKLEAPGKE